MPGKSASLLTKTQRNRIRDNFEDLDEEKKHRDQQRIRERVRSGLLDFQLLADYPDRQFALILDDVSDDKLRAALADTMIVVERLREQSEIDRADVIEEIRIHIERNSGTVKDTRTLDQIDLRTTGEVRRQVKEELEDQFGPGRWDRRANGLMKLGVGVFILIVLILIIELATIGNVTQTTLNIPFWGLMSLLFASAVGWLLINTAQSLKYNIIPFLVAFVRDPKAAVRRSMENLIRNPRETVRDSWNEL